MSQAVTNLIWLCLEMRHSLVQTKGRMRHAGSVWLLTVNNLQGRRKKTGDSGSNSEPGLICLLANEAGHNEKGVCSAGCTAACKQMLDFCVSGDRLKVLLQRKSLPFCKDKGHAKMLKKSCWALFNIPEVGTGCPIRYWMSKYLQAT